MFQQRLIHATMRATCRTIATSQPTPSPTLTTLTRFYSTKRSNTHYIHQNNKIKSQLFRPTRVTRDWHQHIDHKTGKFYYFNIFTGEKTNVQPAVFLPHDAPKESGAMAFLRADRADLGGTIKKKSVLRPVITAAVIATTLYTLGELGYLDRLFGYVPPQRYIPFDQKIQDRTKELARGFQDFERV